MVNANVHSVDNANANVRRSAQKKTTEEQVRLFAIWDARDRDGRATPKGAFLNRRDSQLCRRKRPK
jgi:hypothetical protein